MPPAGNANYAWLQHMLYHLKPGGRAYRAGQWRHELLQNNEGDIRAPWWRKTSSSAWSLCPASSSSTPRSPPACGFGQRQTARHGEVLFIDARKLGTAVSRVQIELTPTDIARIADTFHAWKADGETDKPRRYPRLLPLGFFG
jgi:type I restriction enzyme M protein